MLIRFGGSVVVTSTTTTLTADSDSRRLSATIMMTTTPSSLLYGEVWFVVVVCVACVILLIVFTLLLIKCTCPRQRSYVRQRVPLGHVPLDQSVSTSPPSYRRHYYYQQPILFDKSRHTVCITPHLTNCYIEEGRPREKTRIDWRHCFLFLLTSNVRCPKHTKHVLSVRPSSRVSP